MAESDLLAPSEEVGRRRQSQDGVNRVSSSSSSTASSKCHPPYFTPDSGPGGLPEGSSSGGPTPAAAWR